MHSPVIMKMLSMQSSFTPTENEISQYVIKNQDFVITNTISLIADTIGTSEASINRFVRKIGYKGFNNFKIALAQNKFHEELHEEVDENANVNESLSNDYRQMILNTSALIQMEDIDKCTELIKTCKTIHIVSLAYSGFVAQEFASKLDTIGFNVKLHQDVLDIHLSVPNLDANDVIFVLAPSIQTRDLFPFVTSAKDRGSKIVAITSHDFSKLEDVTDIRLITADKNITRNSLSMTNSVMMLFVTDMIYENLLRSDKNLRQKRLNSDAIVSNYQVINHYYYDI